MDLGSEVLAPHGRKPPGAGAGLIVGADNHAARAALWLKGNLFSSLANTILTLVVVAVIAVAAPPVFHWAIGGATISGDSKAACTGDGACWTFIKVRLPLFFYGHYPPAERWRLFGAALMLVLFSAPAMRERTPHRGLFVLLLLTVFPVLAGILLVGGVAGLPYVDTSQWGGLMLNVVISFVVVEAAFLLGILLALGRRSALPVVRLLSVGFIELWRGIPLLIVLIMSAMMVPLFLPEGVTFDRLIRAIVALSLFEAAYMAEAIRGGLQGIPEGQVEAAHSLGLRWWQVQAFVSLPQALRFSFPSIINTVIDLFKDTTLLLFVGVFDLLSAVIAASKDTAWLGYYKEGYVFAMLIFFLCCFTMSLHARRFERRLNRHKRG